MIVYLSPFVTLILLRWGLAGQTRLRDQIYWVVLGAMFLFAAFRFEVGCDWTGYLNQFRIVEGPFYEPTEHWREIGWWVMLDTIEELGLPYPAINIVVAIQFFACMHAVARRQPDPMAFLLALFPVLVIGMAMAALRQAVAIGFVSMAFLALSDGRVRAYAAWVLVGSLFHSSAMIFLLLTPLVGGRYGWPRLILAVLLAVPGGLALLASSAGELAAERYLAGNIEAAGAAYRVAFLGLSGLAYFLILHRAWRRDFGVDVKLAAVGALAMLAIGLLLPFSTVIADRLAYYLVPLQAMIFARIPFLGLRYRAILASLPWIGLVALFAVWLATSSIVERCYLPYQSWLTGFPDDITHSF